MDQRPGAGGFQKKKFKFAFTSNNSEKKDIELKSKIETGPSSESFQTNPEAPLKTSELTSLPPSTRINPLGEEEKVARPAPGSFLKINENKEPTNNFKESPFSENYIEEKEFKRARSSDGLEEEEEEGDPLDSFMAGIESQAREEAVCSNKAPRPSNLQDEQEDHMETFLKYRKHNKPVSTRISGGGGNSDDEVYATARAVDLQNGEGEDEYDSEDNPLAPNQRKEILPLAPVDHGSIEYINLKKCFYKEHDEIRELNSERVQSIRKEGEVVVQGRDVPNPCLAFAHFQFDHRLLSKVAHSQYERPTPIQQQAVPCALLGRDVIGIAQTGSGKTAAYLWPMLIHAIAQPALEAREGPIGLVLAPTRELAHQIGSEARKFAKAYGGLLRVGVVSGGFSKLDQFKELRAGVEILIATPGRLIDLIKMKATNLTRVSYLVVDEADRLLDLGFEPQVVSITNNARPDKQTLLFSATFPNSIDRLTRRLLNDPIRITVGGMLMANLDVTQTFEILADPGLKWNSLLQRLPNILLASDTGRVIIFISTKIACEQLSTSLLHAGYPCLSLHGDLSQVERDDTLSRFKSGGCRLLIATDVAARGLDVAGIQWVINYDAARDNDTHTHRVGRTGRAGQKGNALTLLTPENAKLAGDLVLGLESVDQDVPRELLDLALKHPKFRKMRQGRGHSHGHRGGGYGGGGRNNRGRFNSNFSRPNTNSGGIGFNNHPQIPSSRGGRGGSSTGGFIKFQPASDSSTSK